MIDIERRTRDSGSRPSRSSHRQQQCRGRRRSLARGAGRRRSKPSLRPQGAAAAGARRNREHPPPRSARTRGRLEICDHRLCQGFDLGRGQSSPRARQPARGGDQGRAHPQPARRGGGDRARALERIRAPRHPPDRPARRTLRPQFPPGDLRGRARRPADRHDHRGLQPGYVLHDRLLRPAMVGVSKQPANLAEPRASPAEPL